MSSSSSSFDVEITAANQKETIDLHQLADKTQYHQTENFSEASLSFSYLDGNNLHEKILPAGRKNSMNYKIDEIDAAMNKGQSEGDKWRRSSKNTALPLPQHIIVERKRRRELNQRFLALSKVVPAGINKKDRASILGEAVKYMKDLQERIKKLEDMNTKKVVESVVFVKSSSSSSSSPSSISSSNQYYYRSHQSNNEDGDYYNCSPSYKRRRSLIFPEEEEEEEEEEIEAKVIESSVLIRVHCRNNNNNQKQEILATLLSSISELHLIVLTANALPFGNHIDITVIAQMGVNFYMKTKDIVDHLRLKLPNFN
ncbi:hypothetical protein K1719_012667 [Acacia pycnantha]|nr:hypothetical protein K1719_012667 [Acacia pycnantha]